MKLNEAILSAFKNTVLVEDQPQIAITNFKQIEPKPIAEPEVVKSEIKPEEPQSKEISEPEQKENPTDYKNITASKVYTLITSKIVSSNDEFLEEDINSFVKKINDILDKWSAKLRINNIKVEYIEHDKKQISFQFIFKAKEYPFKLAVNESSSADLSYNEFTVLTNLGENFVEIINRDDISKLSSEYFDKNILANAYLLILDNVWNQ